MADEQIFREDLDSLWQTVHRLGRRVSELEQRLAELEAGPRAPDFNFTPVEKNIAAPTAARRVRPEPAVKA